MSRPAYIRTHRAEHPNRRPLLVGALLVALTSVPTAIVVVAGSAALNAPGARQPGPARRSEPPVIIDRQAHPGPAGPLGPSDGGAVAAPGGGMPPGGAPADPGPLGLAAQEESGGAGGGTGAPLTRASGVRPTAGAPQLGPAPGADPSKPCPPPTSAAPGTGSAAGSGSGSTAAGSTAPATGGTGSAPGGSRPAGSTPKGSGTASSGTAPSGSSGSSDRVDDDAWPGWDTGTPPAPETGGSGVLGGILGGLLG